MLILILIQRFRAKYTEIIAGIIATIWVEFQYLIRKARALSNAILSSRAKPIAEESGLGPMTRPIGVEPTLLDLPLDVRTMIWEYALSIDKKRVEHSSYWRELSEGEFDLMIGKIQPSQNNGNSDRERSQKGYKKKVVCELDFSLMLTNKQCYRDGLEIMRHRNKFVQIDGWTGENYEALAELGDIPIWAYQPVWDGEILVAQPLPCKVEPVFRLAYSHDRPRSSIFISIKDLPLVCKSLYHLHSYPAPQYFLLKLVLKIPRGGVTPVFWGFKTEAEVRDFFQCSMMRYLGALIMHAHWGKEGKVIDTPQEGTFRLHRRLNTLEAWIVENIQSWKHELEKPKHRYMHDRALSLFNEAEQADADGGLSTAIDLYVELKALVDQLCREDLFWEEARPPVVLLDLYMKYSICCFRLSTMAGSLKKLISTNQPDSSLATKQWAYVNAVEALSMTHHIGGQPRIRANLLMNQAALKLELQRYPDASITSAICLATFEMIRYSMPLVRRRTLMKYASRYFREGRRLQVRHWKEEVQSYHGYYFSNRKAWDDPLETSYNKIENSEWKLNFERVLKLFQDTFQLDPSHVIQP